MKRPPVSYHTRQTLGSRLLPPRIMNPEFPPGTPQWKKTFHYTMVALGCVGAVVVVGLSIKALHEVVNTPDPQPRPS